MQGLHRVQRDHRAHKPLSIDTSNLGAYTKQQLVDFAAERGIGGVSMSMTKAEIIAAIEAAL